MGTKLPEHLNKAFQLVSYVRDNPSYLDGLKHGDTDTIQALLDEVDLTDEHIDMLVSDLDTISVILAARGWWRTGDQDIVGDIETVT